MNISEFIGYFAGILVAVSLMMSSSLKLRILNLAGAIVFLIYGIIINAYPIAVINFVICIADLMFLIKYIVKKEYFSVINPEQGNDYLIYFIKFYMNDIKKLYSGYSYKINKKTEFLMIMRNTIPVGIILFERKKDGICFIYLDYVVPRYRDMKPGKFVFKEYSEKFFSEGILKFNCISFGKNHEKYLKKMGFTRITVSGRKNIFERSIKV